MSFMERYINALNVNRELPDEKFFVELNCGFNTITVKTSLEELNIIKANHTINTMKELGTHYFENYRSNVICVLRNRDYIPPTSYMYEAIENIIHGHPKISEEEKALYRIYVGENSHITVLMSIRELKELSKKYPDINNGIKLMIRLSQDYRDRIIESDNKAVDTKLSKEDIETIQLWMINIDDTFPEYEKYDSIMKKLNILMEQLE